MSNLEWYKKSTAELFEILKTNRATGLSSLEAEARKEKYGANALPKSKTDSYPRIFWRQLNAPLLHLLMAAALIKLLLEGYSDAIIILVIIFINTLIGAIQEGKAQSIFESLQNFIATTCIVVRDGTRTIINEYELVPGDIIILQEGARVPADARIIESSLIKVDESMLTGESTGVEKNNKELPNNYTSVHDRKNMVFMGTYILSGSGAAVVVATGLEAEVGKLKKSLDLISMDMPLQKDMVQFTKIIMIAACLASALLFFIGMYWGNSVEEMLFTLTSLFVAVVPESLSVITTIVLAVGAYRMAQSKVLIKRLPAIEALGRIDVLVVDKTGTLTHNEQSVVQIYSDNLFYQVTGEGYQAEGAIFLDNVPVKIVEGSTLWSLGLVAALIDQSELNFDAEKKIFTLKGEPMHAALGVLAAKVGFNRKELEKEYHKIDEIPFTPENRRSISWYQHKNNVIMIVSGAPEIILEACKSNDTLIKNALEKMLTDGLRMIALASKTYALEDHQKEKENFENLRLLGFVGTQDSLRSNLKEIVKKIKDSGIHMIMATGDHKKTAVYVAKKAGIFTSSDYVLTGEDFSSLNENQIAEELKKTTVLARVTPQEKIEVVKGCHTNKKIVGMTGDGVNDAPALVAADVGIAMGVIGTAVAQDAADIILLDDSLESIVVGIEQGRHILNTLHCTIFFLFTTSLNEFLLISISIFMKLPLPLLATQILWENLVTDGFLGIGLSMEPLDQAVLSQPKLESIFVTRKTLGKLLWMGIHMTLGSLFVFFRYYKIDVDLARTMTLVTIAMFQWFNAWNLRSLYRSVFSLGLFTNQWIFRITVGIMGLQIFAVYNSFMQKMLHIVPLQPHHWLEALIISSTILIAEEMRKWLLRKKLASTQSKNQGLI